VALSALLSLALKDQTPPSAALLYSASRASHDPEWHVVAAVRMFLHESRVALNPDGRC
jgi:hypothetical protein